MKELFPGEHGSEKEFLHAVEAFNRESGEWQRPRHELSRYMGRIADRLAGAGYRGTIIGVHLPSGPQAVLVEKSEYWEGIRYCDKFTALVGGDDSLVQTRALITERVERHSDGSETRTPWRYT